MCWAHCLSEPYATLSFTVCKKHSTEPDSMNLSMNLRSTCFWSPYSEHILSLADILL